MRLRRWAAAASGAGDNGFTLIGLVQHMAEVERNWFRRVLAGEQAPPIYDPRADPNGPDGGFELAPGATLGESADLTRRIQRLWLAVWVNAGQHGTSRIGTKVPLPA